MGLSFPSFRTIVSVVFPVHVLANGWSYFFRRKRREAKAIDSLSGVPDYVASGAAVPMVFGTVRTALFVAQRAQTSVATAAGTVQTINEASEFKTYGLVLGVCQGTITAIRRTWIDRVQVPVATATSAAVGFSLEPGDLDQPGIQNRKVWRFMAQPVPSVVEQVFTDQAYPVTETVTFTLYVTPAAVIEVWYEPWNAGTASYDTGWAINFTASGNQVTVSRVAMTPSATYRLTVRHISSPAPDVFLREYGIEIDAGSSRSFLPDFADATTIKISGATAGGHSIDGTYDVASVTDKRITLTDPNTVQPEWPGTLGLRKYVWWGTGVGPGPWWLEYQEAALQLHYPGLAHLRADPLDHKALFDALKVNIPGGTLAAISDAATQTQGWEAEVSGALCGAGADGLDAAPGDIVTDLLTSSTFYGAGLDASRFDITNGPDGLAASGFVRACDQSGFTLSMLLSNQRPITEILDEIARACDAVVIDSAGVLRFYPLAERAVGTYAPANRPVYDLDTWNFVPAEGDDPVEVELEKDASTYNVAPVEFTDRAASYSKQLAEVAELADVRSRGLRVSSPAALPCIMNRDHAEAISQAMGLRLVNGRAVFTFPLAWNRGALLEPGDILRISDSKLGLDRVGVRVTSVAETPDGKYTITAERYLGVLGTTVYLPA